MWTTVPNAKSTAPDTARAKPMRAVDNPVEEKTLRFLVGIDGLLADDLDRDRKLDVVVQLGSHRMRTE
jgi:hypothetical protein